MNKKFAGILFFWMCSLSSYAAVKVTIYNDGVSCPGNCDAHVVFHKEMNGTKSAHSPKSKDGNFEKCSNGEVCRICFDDSGTECLEVMYRGAGPHKGTFDFTPAFYEETCPKEGLPKVLESQCKSLQKSAEKLEKKINCIKNQEEQPCKDLIEKAKEEQQSDKQKYDTCIQLGEEKYNKDKPQEDQRSNNCTYEKYGTGKNSQGKTWKKLLPGSCVSNTFVGRDGLDCCTGIALTDGPLGKECSRFYVEK